MPTEFGLIEKFKKILKTRDRRVRLGVGDDTAVLSFGKENLLFTCDAVVENIHFDLHYFSFFDVGWRLACGNLSDIAAMGGKPLAAIITLGVRKGLSEKTYLKLIKGFQLYSRSLTVQSSAGTSSAPRNFLWIWQWWARRVENI